MTRTRCSHDLLYYKVLGILSQQVAKHRCDLGLASILSSEEPDNNTYEITSPFSETFASAIRMVFNVFLDYRSRVLFLSPTMPATVFCHMEEICPTTSNDS